jgi:short-subunit dehydrogenase
VNVGSCFGWIGVAGKAGYCASKFAVRGFSEALRAELRPSGIGVTVLYPGPVDTNLVRDGRIEDERDRAPEVALLASRGLSPALVARRTIRAIERDAARVVIGRDYRALDLAARLSPAWTPALVSRVVLRLADRRAPQP